MPVLKFEERIARQTLYEMGYEYIRDNFHKFNMENKIRVSMDILKVFNKDDSKTPQMQNFLTLVFDEESKKRLEQMTGKLPLEIPTQT